DAVASHAAAGLALARRYRLGQLEPALLVCAAAGRALRADTVGMEALLTRADALGDEPMERIAALAQARATCAFATDDLHAAARATFVGLDLPAPAAGCAAALRRLQPPGHRAGALTPREDDVLSLVEQGLSNRAIAERLFLSARTVEKHVERLLAKTGQTNRT